jgi:hypothetical protein
LITAWIWFFSSQLDYFSSDQLTCLKGSKLAFSSTKESIPNISDDESQNDYAASSLFPGWHIMICEQANN